MLAHPARLEASGLKVISVEDNFESVTISDEFYGYGLQVSNDFMTEFSQRLKIKELAKAKNSHDVIENDRNFNLIGTLISQIPCFPKKIMNYIDLWIKSVVLWRVKICGWYQGTDINVTFHY